MYNKQEKRDLLETMQTPWRKVVDKYINDRINSLKGDILKYKPEGSKLAYTEDDVKRFQLEAYDKVLNIYRIVEQLTTEWDS